MSPRSAARECGYSAQMPVTVPPASATRPRPSYGLEDVDRVAQNLSSRDMDEVTNDAMVARVRDAIQSGRPLSEGEQNFMEHELTEARLMDEGMSYDDARTAALETHPPFKNYDPEVIEQFPDYFNNAWRRAWGLPPR